LEIISLDRGNGFLTGSN